VVDLGSGGGLDVFLAVRRVGPTGKAIGIDMTPEMLDRARAGAAKQGLTNVAFHHATIDRLPLPDAGVDCIISNCVINLAPDKRAVFREMFRVLRPGGRVAISDIALKQPLPGEVAGDVMAYVGCIAGALLIPEYEAGLREAGFEAVQLVDTRKDLNAYTKIENEGSCCSPSASSATGLPLAGSGCSSAPPRQGRLAELLARYNVNDYAASVQVYAVKGR
jgi:ubiquinone/menaquinone biosynthesis C-methylase UbiE